MSDQYPPQQPWQSGQDPSKPGGQQFPPPPYGQQPPSSGQPFPPQPYSQQFPPGGQVPPQAPPRKRHRVRNTVLGVLGVFVVIGVIGNLTGSGKTKTNTTAAVSSSSPSASAASATPAAATYTAAQEKYFQDVKAGPFGVFGSAPDHDLAQLGAAVCHYRQVGGSQAHAVASAAQHVGKRGRRFVVLTERDLCPSEIPAKPRVIATFSGSGIQNTAQFTVPSNWVLRWSYNCSSYGGQGNFIVDEDNGNDMNGANVNELNTGGSGETHVYGDAGTHYLSINSECSWSMKVVTS